MLVTPFKKHWKIIFIFFLFCSLASAVMVKLFFIQIKNGQYYQALALGQQVSFGQTIGQRGEIFWSDSHSSQAPSATLAQITKKEKLSQLEDGATTTRQVLSRFYPYKELAANVIGFVNEDGQGQYGIEGYYNEVLRGTKSIGDIGKSPFGYLASVLDLQNEPFLSKGADLWLTLDYNVQYFAQKLLKEAREKWQIESGQIVVAEPFTGKILALANWPSFDPNFYSQEADLAVFLNSATQKLFEPGSVFKPITMAGGLEEGLITSETIYKDKGFVDLGGPKIYNFEKRVWGEQSMTDVLEESINTGAVFVQEQLGEKKFLKYLDKFGFFEKTGIDLQGEVSSKNESLKRGYRRDLAAASFGQGVEMTTIQLVRAFSAIANGGKLLKPYLVEKMVDERGREIVTETEVQAEAFSAEAAAELTAMLVSVVEQGSGRLAKTEGYFIAGKTGTAQVVLERGGYHPDKTIQSFIGYFPAFSPRVLIFVRLDNPRGVKSASYSAVPIFAQLAKHIIGLWQIPPDYE